ncbi:MAG: hypothetical protein ACT4N4_09660 [Rhodospirillales bacterium]
MTPDRFRELIDAYGGDPKRWPASERDAALAHARADARAGAMLDRARALDALLDGMKVAPPAIDPARIVAAATRAAQEPASANVLAFVRRRGGIRPAMAWARGAALAAATICGFVIGMSDPGGGGDANALDLLDQLQAEDSIW